MLRRIFVGLLPLIIGVSAQVPRCPNTLPVECRCNDHPYGPEIFCITIAMETWDIQSTFDAVSDAFNNTNDTLYRIVINTGLLTTPGQEVPVHSVSTLKTENLYIWADHKYARIDPDAFSGTHFTTTQLGIYEMDFQDSDEAFDLINNFQVLRTLILDGDTTLTKIPDHAFDNDLQSLEYIAIRGVGLQSIGYLPFAELPNLTDIRLEGNELTLGNISDSAFTVSTTGINLRLERNPGITHLPEEKFGNFLRGNENRIYVGYEYGNCNPAYLLQCDDRIDWICDAGVTRIYGYYCIEPGYGDIFGYCQQKFGNSLLYGQNLEQVKKFQMTDRLHYESLKIEEEFRRRYNANQSQAPKSNSRVNRM